MFEPHHWDIEQDYYHLNPGGHFFDRDTMRFFSSRLGVSYYRREDGAYVFVTSERDTMRDENVRAHTVRVMDRSGWIETVGDFNSYSASVANRMALQLARRGWTMGPAPEHGGDKLNSLRERHDIPTGGLYHPEPYKTLRKLYPDVSKVSRRDLNRLISPADKYWHG